MNEHILFLLNFCCLAFSAISLHEAITDYRAIRRLRRQ